MSQSCFFFLAAVSACAAVNFGCESKPSAPPAPEPAPSAEPAAGKSSSKSKQDDDDDPSPTAAVAYPPGEGPKPDPAAQQERAPRTGVCSLLETGYDGMDTKSTEKLIVKVKEEQIVAASYTYRGSYALDGKSDSLSIPLKEGKWLAFELPMTTGTKEFKIKLRRDVMLVKGTAALDKEGSCTWETPPDSKKGKR
jgi:hypothetical protein